MSTDISQCLQDQSFTETLEYAVQGIYGCLSVVVYIFNVAMLLRVKQSLHKTFIRLYIASAFWSSLYFLLHWGIKRFMGLGYFCEAIYLNFSQPNWYIHPYRVLTTYCPILLLVLNFLISFQRVTSILYPVHSRHIWEEHVFLIFIVAHLFPFTCMWFVLPSRGYVYFNTATGKLSFNFERIQWFLGDLSASFFAAIAGVGFGSLTLINVIIIIYFTKRRRLKADRGMLSFEILMVIFTLIYAVSQAYLYFTGHLFPNPDQKAIVESFRTYLIDLFCLPQAWILFVFNRKIRKELSQMIAKKISVTTTIADK